MSANVKHTHTERESPSAGLSACIPVTCSTKGSVITRVPGEGGYDDPACMAALGGRSGVRDEWLDGRCRDVSSCLWMLVGDVQRDSDPCEGGLVWVAATGVVIACMQGQDLG